MKRDHRYSIEVEKILIAVRKDARVQTLANALRFHGVHGRMLLGFSSTGRFQDDDFPEGKHSIRPLDDGTPAGEASAELAKFDAWISSPQGDRPPTVWAKTSQSGRVVATIESEDDELFIVNETYVQRQPNHAPPMRLNKHYLFDPQDPPSSDSPELERLHTCTVLEIPLVGTQGAVYIQVGETPLQVASRMNGKPTQYVDIEPSKVFGVTRQTDGSNVVSLAQHRRESAHASMIQPDIDL